VEGTLSTNFLRALIATCAIAFAACTPPAFAQINQAEVAVRRAISRQIPIGATVKLLNVSHHVHQLLVITSLLSVFDLFESEDDAVRSFGSPKAAH
jgi:hypothetical protein